MLDRFAAIAAAVLAFAAPAPAYDTPRALVEGIYAQYEVGGTPPAPETYFSEALIYLVEEKIAKEGEEAEIIGFDPFINGQDYLLHELKIGEPEVIGDRAVVNVTFHNFDHPSALTLSLIQEKGAWKVDDIASMGVERHWLLSWLLAFDPFAVN